MNYSGQRYLSIEGEGHERYAGRKEVPVLNHMERIFYKFAIYDETEEALVETAIRDERELWIYFIR